MKRIINGRTYDIGTSELVAEHIEASDTGDEVRTISLFRNGSGVYFTVEEREQKFDRDLTRTIFAWEVVGGPDRALEICELLELTIFDDIPGLPPEAVVESRMG